MFKQISTFVRSKLPVLGVQNHSNHRYSTHRHRTQKDSRIPTARNSVVRAILWTAAISTLTLTVFDGFQGDLASAATSANPKALNHRPVNRKSVNPNPASHKPTHPNPVSHKPTHPNPVSRNPVSHKPANPRNPNRQSGHHKLVAFQTVANNTQFVGQRPLASQLGGSIVTNYKTYCQPDRSSIKPLCGGSGPDLETTPVSSQQTPKQADQASDNGFGLAQFQADPLAEEEILFSAKSKPVVLYQYDRTIVVQQVL